MDVGVRHSQVYIWALSPATFVILDHVTNISELHFLNAVLGWLNTLMSTNTEHWLSNSEHPYGAYIGLHTWPRVKKYNLLALAVLGSLWSLLVPYSPNFIHARKHAFPQFNNTEMEYICDYWGTMACWLSFGCSCMNLILVVHIKLCVLIVLHGLHLIII